MEGLMRITEPKAMIEVVVRGEVLREKEVGGRMIVGIAVLLLTRRGVHLLIAIMRMWMDLCLDALAIMSNGCLK